MEGFNCLSIAPSGEDGKDVSSRRDLSKDLIGFAFFEITPEALQLSKLAAIGRA
ncbi:hypothetical protein HPP92_015803 [Vanilla planifolia]|uniref:Uncharacterized protein n=1 Tax=Vanilla planifolia TaxID=51239 RepID=A0A835QIK3_VANPL|nr:hypothetical protein HPP92_015803 [Vanilla planifolia]